MHAHGRVGLCSTWSERSLPDVLALLPSLQRRISPLATTLGAGTDIAERRVRERSWPQGGGDGGLLMSSSQPDRSMVSESSETCLPP